MIGTPLASGQSSTMQGPRSVPSTVPACPSPLPVLPLLRCSKPTPVFTVTSSYRKQGQHRGPALAPTHQGRTQGSLWKPDSVSSQSFPKRVLSSSRLWHSPLMWPLSP